MFIEDFLGSVKMRVQDILKQSRLMEGPVVKRLALQGVSRGEVLVKFDLQINS